ncbi:MAG: hypothetical protein WB562_06395 [Candidatus Sulfotelmatobacter sp.]
MKAIAPNRLKFVLSVLGFLVVMTPLLTAQENTGETPLGDVARSFRKKPAVQQEVIDNDNFSQAMDSAEKRRVAGDSSVFSLDPGGKNFRVSMPDVTCSLSFSANASSLLSEPLALDELPRNDLMKLDGPATIDGDTLQISVHNGTQWDLREVVVGLTIVRQRDGDASSYHPARVVPAAVSGPASPTEDSTEKRPDVTVLFRIKGAAAPSSTAVFRTPLNFALVPEQEWHWAIVRAKGIAPQTTAEIPQRSAQ